MFLEAPIYVDVFVIVFAQNVVLLLLEYNADVSVINGEGRTPLQMANSDEVKNLIEGETILCIVT